MKDNQNQYFDAVKYFNLGLAYSEQNQYSDAIKCLQKSAQLGCLDAQKKLLELGKS